MGLRYQRYAAHPLGLHSNHTNHALSQAHAKSFTYSTNLRYSSHPLYQYIQINVQENLLKALLVKLYARSLWTLIPPEQRPNYLISSQNLEYLRDPMGMTNSKVGYVYLIDENLRIRWAGSAEATQEEAQSLESCTGVLLKRLSEKQAEKGADATKNASVKATDKAKASPTTPS